jgi:aspartate aminotransferase
MLAERLRRVQGSPTMKVAAEAARLRAAGVDIADLGAGEPDFPTPDHVSRAAHAAIDAGFTKYTANVGLSDLREAIAARYRLDYGIDPDPGETIVTAGGKQAMFNVALALFGPGDEVICHAPVWPTIPEQIRLADATPVVVRTYAEEGFRLSAERVIGAMGPRTRGLVLNSPCNPTGAVIDDGALGEIADEAARRGLWIVADLCYEHLVYGGRRPRLPAVLFSKMRDRTVLCGSTSKTYAMTGWRCGWAIAPREVIAACNTIQGHSTSNASSVSQRAALAALTGPQACVRDMLQAYERRRDLAMQLFATEGPWRCAPPEGAFYLFLDVGDSLDSAGTRTSVALAEALLHEARVALFAGEGFDAPGYVRISYATSEAQLREAAVRVARFLAAGSQRDAR